MNVRGWLERNGLGTREARAWASYDWANSAMITVVVTAVFPVFYSTSLAEGVEPAKAKSAFLYATTAALLLSAFLGPVLGAHADARGRRKLLLALSMGVGVLAVGMLATCGVGDWRTALVAFGVANLGATVSFVFYDSLLPFVGKPHELDRISTAAYGIGYLGGGLALLVCATLIAQPELIGLTSGIAAVRTSFVIVALWWLVFSIPLLRGVPEPPPAAPVSGAPLGAFRQLASTFRVLRAHPQALLVLVAFLVYNDGIVTIIRMAGMFAEERGLEPAFILKVLLLVQFVALPAAFAYGALARRFGTKRAVLAGVAGYAGITVLAGWMSSERDFVILALCVALVQGGVQALSRSMFASLVPPERSAEFFGLFGVAEKFASILGPLVLAVATQATGNSPWTVLVLLPFFLIGGVLLARVDLERGRAAIARPTDGA
jgi:UMF1 family MFS transporter